MRIQTGHGHAVDYAVGVFVRVQRRQAVERSVERERPQVSCGLGEDSIVVGDGEDPWTGMDLKGWWCV